MKKSKKLLLGFATIASAFLILGQLFSYPNSIRDLATGKIPFNCTLTYPLLYKIFAPFFLFADTLTILSLKQHITLLVWANILWILSRLYLIWRTSVNVKFILKEFGFFFLFQIFVSLTYAGVVLVPRPMAALFSNEPDTIIIDFHSHTQASWDARKSFSLEKNLLWHRKAGFHAGFITDHNVFANSVPSNVNGVQALRGEEVSLYQSHWVLLGVDRTMSNEPYDNGVEGIEKFIQDSKGFKDRALFVSLPEYWFYHWGSPLEKFADWGVDGFEIANSSPLALDFPGEFREAILALCRKRNLAVVGVSDNHGWGSACYVWNLISIHGWRSLNQNELERAIISKLKAEGFNSVRVVARIKNESYPFGFRRWSDPLLQILEVTRSIPWHLFVISLLWIWLPTIKCCIKGYNDSRIESP